MKRIIAMSVIATGMLFAAGPIELGVVQSNNVAGITTALGDSAIKQGSIEIYGNSSVTNPIAPVPNVVAVNGVLGALYADGNSTIEQGTLQISDSNVAIVKSEVNAMAAGALATGNSEVSQGKWKIVDVHGTSSINNVLQTNAMLALASATNDSKITQGNIEVGSVDDVGITVVGIPAVGGNKLVGLIVANNGSKIDQGSIKICGNTHLALCGN